ncbi:hypothetical protein E3P77_02570 [Wallemia ichthyophaga]|nr:hypothetical protein E3P77_02570 [Wallemia ichthyophaga]
MELYKRRKISKLRVCDACRRRDIETRLENNSNSCSRCEQSAVDCLFEEAPAKGKKYKELYYDLEEKHAHVLSLMRKLHPGIDIDGLQSTVDTLSIDGDHFDQQAAEEQEHEVKASEDFLRSAQTHDPRVLGSASVFKLRSVERIRAMAVGSSSTSFDIHQRSQYWSPVAWKIDDRDFDPPQELIDSLVEIYFENTGCHRPLLHKRTFKEGNIQDIDHQRILWLVCAIGSRLSDDTCVLDSSEVKADGTPHSYHSAGWPFFMKYVSIAKPIAALSPSLADLQQSALAAVFLHSLPSHSSSWTIAAQGLIMAKDLGANFHSTSTDPVKDELRRRAFWNLYQIESEMATYLGRDSTIDERTIGIDRPRALPDENERDFYAYNAFLDLIIIARNALDWLYDEELIREAPNDAIKAQQMITNVTELDSRLDQWIITQPDFLQWNEGEGDEPSRECTQRCTNMSLFLMVQTLIHRPFLNASGHLRSLSISSSALCGSAAQSLAQVVSVFRQIDPRTDTVVSYAFISCVSALVVQWTSKAKGAVVSNELDKAVDTLHSYIRSRESRYYVAGRLSDIIAWLRDENTTAGSIEELFNTDIESLLNSTIYSAHFFNSLPPLTSLEDSNFIA